MDREDEQEVFYPKQIIRVLRESEVALTHGQVIELVWRYLLWPVTYPETKNFPYTVDTFNFPL